MTALEVIRHPNGREFVVEARPRGLRRGGNDASSLALDAAGWLTNRFRREPWVVEVRPWPTGRAVLKEHATGQDAAVQRAEVVAQEITAGTRSL